MLAWYEWFWYMLDLWLDSDKDVPLQDYLCKPWGPFRWFPMCVRHSKRNN